MKLNSVLIALTLAGSLVAANSVVTEARKQIADKKYDEAIAALEAADRAKPQPEVKKVLGEAYLGKADSLMYNDSLPPRAKYPQALRAYREVLKYDKDNKKAKEGIATIEGIYKQMGRPIPQ